MSLQHLAVEAAFSRSSCCGTGSMATYLLAAENRAASQLNGCWWLGVAMLLLHFKQSTSSVRC